MAPVRIAMLSAALSLVTASLVAAPASAQPDGCRGIDCSGHGRCFTEQRVPLCLCDQGYASVGTSCVEVDEPDVFRLRRSPTAGIRAAEFAATQVGRRRSTIQDERVNGLEPLGAYLVPEEWWCTDFVSWVYAAAGVPFTQGAAGGWLITNNLAMREWYREHHLWVERRSREFNYYVPAAGDFVRIRTRSGGGHAAIVHHITETTAYLVEGNVGGQVLLQPYYHYRDNPLIEGFGILSPPNRAPEIEVGDPVEALTGHPVELAAEVTDDGPENELIVGWTIVEGGSEGITWTARDVATTGVTFLIPSTYTARITATDGEHEVTADLRVVVRQNSAPLVTAAFRDDHLRGTLEDDALPRAATLRWSQVSGPRGAVFETPDALETVLDLPESGTYVFRLTADDGELSTQCDVTVEAPPFWGNCATVRYTSGAGPSPWLLLIGFGIGLKLRYGSHP